jgi:hypothetical protein
MGSEIRTGSSRVTHSNVTSASGRARSTAATNVAVADREGRARHLQSGRRACVGPGLVPTLSFPAVSAVVTVIGGTRLGLDAQDHRAAEVVWSDTQYGELAAGGGGLALRAGRPPYQTASTPYPLALSPTSARSPISIRAGPCFSTAHSRPSAEPADHRRSWPPPPPSSTPSNAPRIGLANG